MGEIINFFQGFIMSNNTIALKVPDIGGSNNVNVSDIFVKVGDSIKINDNVVALETDKAIMEVPSTISGEIKEIKIKVGDKLNEGDIILLVDSKSNSETAQFEKKEAKTNIVEPEKIEKNHIKQDVIADVNISDDKFKDAYASPSIRKLARELGVDLTRIIGSGSKGRVTDEDLKMYVKGIMSNSGGQVSGNLNLIPWPKVDFAKFGQIEVKELSRIKKLSSSNLARNWVMIPHVTQFDEADITELEEFRKSVNNDNTIKVTILAFLIKAVSYVLKEFPEFNSSIDGSNIVFKKYYNIGFAVDTANGLVVAVLKDADKKGLLEIAGEVAKLASLARDGKLSNSDMSGGTFTISSLGGIGGTAFTPIINAPEVAILGVSKAKVTPVYNGKEFLPRLIMPLSISYDHRVIDGALAAKFSLKLSVILSDIKKMIL